MLSRLMTTLPRSSSSSSFSSVRCISSTPSVSSSSSSSPQAGGYGNVTDQMLPSTFSADPSATYRSRPLFRPIPSPMTVSVIPAPMTYGQPFMGTDQGPQLLLDSGLKSALTSLGWRVESCAKVNPDVQGSEVEDVKGGGKVKNSLRVGLGCKALAEVTYSKSEKGLFPLTLGGDHSVALGSLAGVLRSRPNTGVIWVDAHADLNTPWISDSGNMHGMPIGLLMDEMFPEGCDRTDIPGLSWLDESWEGDDSWPAYSADDPPPRLRPNDIVYVGLRDVDQKEREAIKRLGIHHYTMYDIDRYGVGEVMEKATRHLFKNDPARPVHLSYDIDAVDPAQAPATGTAVRGGLTYREAHFIAEFACSTGQLASADIVELNPTLSDQQGADDTTELGFQLITSMMGKSII